jgi:hypothetical protein
MTALLTSVSASRPAPEVRAAIPGVTYRWQLVSAATNGNERWSAVATSADGAVAIAGYDVPDGAPHQVRITRNGGVTWSALTGAPSALWSDLAISANGSVFAMAGTVSAQSSVWISRSGGASFTAELSEPNTVYSRLAMSDDGSKMLVVSSSGVLVSTTSGTSFVGAVGLGGVTEADVAISGDGTTMYVAETGGGVSVSTDDGMSWSMLGAAGSHTWSSWDVSRDGQMLMGVVGYEQPTVSARVSLNGGGGFTDVTEVGETFADQLATGAVSANGFALVATSYGTSPMASFDGGSTWGDLGTEISGGGGRGWLRFAFSADGTRLYAAVEGEGVWMRSPAPPTITGINPSTLDAGGGQTLTITGTNLVGVTGVTVGGVSLPVTTVSAAEVRVTTPTLTGDEVEVTVATLDGSFTTTAAVERPSAIGGGSSPAEALVTAPVATTASPSTGSPAAPSTGPAPTTPSGTSPSATAPGTSDQAPTVPAPSPGQIADAAPAASLNLPARATAGDMITIEADGFTPGAWVYVYVASDPMLVATTLADAGGRIRTAFRVPPLSGAHSLLLYEPSTASLTRHGIVIDLAALPRTGTSTMPVPWALVLLLAGAALLMISTRTSRPYEQPREAPTAR